MSGPMGGNTNAIAVARIAKGLTQIQLCLKAKVSLSTLRNAERGLATRATLTRLARVLSVPFEAIAKPRDGAPLEQVSR